MARFVAAHGRTEIHKRSINKMIGPKKDMISVAQREREVTHKYRSLSGKTGGHYPGIPRYFS